jgi:hypothetical protein
MGIESCNPMPEHERPYGDNLPELHGVLTKDRPRSVAAFAERLFEVEEVLPSTEVEHCDSFNHVYGTLSDKVDRHQEVISGRGSFKEKATLQMISPEFGNLYLDPLLAVVEGKEPPPAWRHLMVDPRAKEASKSVRFLMGMNTHINVDLAIALWKVNKVNPIPKAYFDDFLIVNDLIDETAHQLSEEFIPLDHPRRRKAATAITIWMVRRWRANAWKDFNRLNSYGDNEKKIEKLIQKRESQTVRRNERILRYGDTVLRAANRPAPLVFFNAI